MHELSITQSIVSDIAEKLGDTRVTKVTLLIGRLSGVVVDSIRFCFDLVAEGTTLEGAELVVHEPLGQVRCPSCQIQFETSDPIVLCPDCGTSEVTVLAGRELRIKSVEVITCAAPAAAQPPK
ncbi:hydrogenase nickel incorporation protein HypA/HybF [Kibdelosporangium banguiense]|uniref:Hydrogenase maturation factor HypA n=1 Tax=Kibdelosporangium banguiense TaxID=1365924 RepID=A0ABS4T7E9_9PSEU|nr:hydrogenase maturation nickel metallochaperone HypA [Kibdelosporangium banguiense]MBP2320045.1 hydrogenase nickel incorporation protein HypA/HybF [Kibdelosporangium banguiense]